MIDCLFDRSQYFRQLGLPLLAMHACGSILFIETEMEIIVQLKSHFLFMIKDFVSLMISNDETLNGGISNDPTHSALYDALSSEIFHKFERPLT